MTPTSIVIALLAILCAYVVQAVNTGSFLGVATIPKPWLPYLGLVGTFLVAGVASISSAHPVNGAAWFDALRAALLALVGSTVGATVHQQLHSRPNNSPSSDDLPSGDRPGKSIPSAVKIVGGMLAGLLLAACGLTAAQVTTVVTDITGVGFCEINYIETTATPTPEGAVAACAGLALTDAEHTFQVLEGAGGDAGTTTALGAKLRAARGAK